MQKSKIFKFVVLSALLAATLSACGGNKVENLAATCESLRSTMKPLESIDILERHIYYSGSIVASQLGDATRASNKRFIYQNFPFMQSYTIESIEAKEYEKGINTLQIQTALHVFQATPNPIVITDEEKAAINASSDPYTEIIEPKVIRVIGESYSDDGCAGLDSANDVDYTYWVDELYEDTQDAAKDSVDHLLSILQCERDGKIDDRKCAKNDYVFTYDYSQSTQPTDEELAILAEREQTAQREALEPSVPTSNVTPFQLCGNLGDVVQTASYGQLTCKYVLINRIRTLAWMRS